MRERKRVCLRIFCIYEEEENVVWYMEWGSIFISGFVLEVIM